MNTKKILLGIIAFFSIIIAITGCVEQNFDQPPTNCSDIVYTPTHTIAELKTLFTGDTTQITDTVILEATLISSDKSGNIYKELVIIDSTGAIALMVDQTYLFTKFPRFQKVYIKATGLYLGEDAGVLKLGALYEEYGIVKFGRIQGEPVIDEHFIKTCDNNVVEPVSVNLTDIDDGMIYKYIIIDSIQFAESELGTTWADGANLISINRNITDKEGNTLIVRTSGYSSFARDSTPTGSGSIIGILGKYNEDYQLYVVDLAEVSMNQTRFSVPLFKDFEDGDIFSGGWQQKIVQGESWTLGTIGGKYVQCRSWNGSNNVATEAWYISPKLDLSAYANPYLNFKNAYKYTGAPLEVKYSTNWNGVSNPNEATWTDLSPVLSTGNFAWVNSGDLTLPTEANLYVAFVYFGTNSDGSTWEVDEIKVADK